MQVSGPEPTCVLPVAPLLGVSREAGLLVDEVQYRAQQEGVPPVRQVLSRQPVVEPRFSSCKWVDGRRTVLQPAEAPVHSEDVVGLQYGSPTSYLKGGHAHCGRCVSSSDGSPVRAPAPVTPPRDPHPALGSGPGSVETWVVGIP